MYLVSDGEGSHIYGLYQMPVLAYEAVKTLFYELDKDVLEEIMEDGSTFPTFLEFQDSFDNDSFPYFDWCGFMVERYDLNRLYRQ